MSRLVLSAAAMIMATATVAESQVVAEYRDAPLVEEISFTNEAACPTGPVELAVYLAGSVGELVFASDPIVASSDGVVLRVAVKPETVAEATQDSLILPIASLAPGGTIKVVIDVESDLEDQELAQIEGGGALIADAEAVLTTADGQEWASLFGRDGRAQIGAPGCAS